MNDVAFGFIGKEVLFSKRLSQVNTADIWTFITDSVAEHNRVVQELTAAFITRTTKAQERFRLPTSGTLEPLDEWGNPKPRKPGEFWDVGYPLQGGGTAFGLNRVSKELITVQEINNLTIERIAEDADWMSRHILSAIMTDDSWEFDDDDLGVITVKPLANGDTDRYPFRGGGVRTDNHLLAQANPISATDNPFPTLKKKLTEHPSNRGPYVNYVATNLVEDIQNLPGFVEVPDFDIRYGSGVNVVSAPLDPAPGTTVIGKVNEMWIVEWESLPDNYMISTAQGTGPFVAQREYPVASLQGFYTEMNSPDGNLQETRFIRWAGFGVRNRIAACVMLIGDATYTPPSGMKAPLKV